MKAILAIHGGAGAISKSEMTPELASEYLKTLDNSLLAGYKVINAGGDSVDAVVAAVKVMEDSPLFNASIGSVLNAAGNVRMEASLMRGKDLQAGAVGDLTQVKNPIELAKLLMQEKELVYLVGDGAIEYAKKHKLEVMPENYFVTPKRIEQLKTIREISGESMVLDHDVPGKMGTVGAVALDQQGHLAAATSTGGRTNKPVGRIGDSSGIGHGTYANDDTCAVSCSGEGEFFIRTVAAHSISMMLEQGKSLQAAVEEIVLKRIPAIGGRGGVIALDYSGNVCMPYNTRGMYRGYIDKDGIPHSFIYES